jgi:hypothetical protein
MLTAGGSVSGEIDVSVGAGGGIFDRARVKATIGRG